MVALAIICQDAGSWNLGPLGSSGVVKVMAADGPPAQSSMASAAGGIDLIIPK